MIEPNIYCKVSGMVMECVSRFYKENSRRPVVVEIGCADGQGTMRFAGFCEHVICVDPMVSDRPDIDSRVKEDMTQDAGKVEVFKRRTKDFPIDLVTGCSLWPETLLQVKEKLKGTPIDILLIDGCHHPFEAVWGDFETYYPLVRNGGYVIFDDLYEECILKAFEKARLDMGMQEVERWSVINASIAQSCGALKRIV